jgi:putative membrane protein
MQTKNNPARISGILLTMALTLGISACTTTDSSASKAAAGASKTMSNGEILQVLQTVNSAELKQAELAFQQPTPAEVQKIAQMMIKDHTASNQKIAAMVKADGIKLEESALSRSLQGQLAQATDRLAKMKDTEFDCSFLKAQVDQHALALDTVRKQLMPAAQSPQVKEFLTSAATSMESHHQAAQKSRASMTECGRA